MYNEKFTIGLIIVIAVLLYSMMGPLYYQLANQVVVTRFGEIVETHTEAGLYFKIPLSTLLPPIQNLFYRLMGTRNEFDKENQFIIVDTTSRWKISDPALFISPLKRLKQPIRGQRCYRFCDKDDYYPK